MAAEDRNNRPYGKWAADDAWRSSLRAAEDGNSCKDGPAVEQVKVTVAPRGGGGSQHRTATIRVVDWLRCRSPFGVTESRNLMAKSFSVDPTEMAVALRRG